MADKEDKDWWGIYDKWDRENMHRFTKGSINLEELEKVKKEVPCTGKPPLEKCDVDLEGLDPLLIGQTKIEECKKWEDFEKREPEKVENKKRSLSTNAARKNQKMIDWRNKALTNAWNALPDGSPIKEMGEENFAVLYLNIDPLKMSVTDHENKIDHSIVQYETMFRSMMGHYKDPELNKNYYNKWCVEYWYREQREWAYINNHTYLSAWDAQAIECSKKIMNNYVIRKKNDNLPLYHGVIMAAWAGGVDHCWVENGVYSQVTKKDVREWLVKDGETINDDTFKSACRVASKLIYIAEAPFKGKDRPETQRRRAKKV